MVVRGSRRAGESLSLSHSLSIAVWAQGSTHCLHRLFCTLCAETMNTLILLYYIFWPPDWRQLPLAMSEMDSSQEIAAESLPVPETRAVASVESRPTGRRGKVGAGAQFPMKLRKGSGGGGGGPSPGGGGNATEEAYFEAYEEDHVDENCC